jgi:hypothetical protein
MLTMYLDKKQIKLDKNIILNSFIIQNLQL